MTHAQNAALAVELEQLTLDSNNAFLSPEACANFDPDTFLLSRRFRDHRYAPEGSINGDGSDAGAQAEVEGRMVQQDLYGILSELKDHGVKLQEELAQIINREYRQFVGLSSEIRSESHRIQRLAQQFSKTPRAHLPNGSLENGHVNGGTQDQDAVQDTCLSARTLLQEAGDDLQSILEARSQATRTRAQLHALLRLEEEVQNLDQLLGLSGTEGKVPRSSSDGLSSQPNRRPDRRVASHKAGQAQDGQNGHDAESQQTLLYEALYMDAEDDADGPSSPSSAAPSQVQRANGVTRQDPARGQASLSPGDLSATWANLQRVRQDYRVVLEQGPSSFVTLLDSKLQRISETLQKQAETLMRTLLSTERDGGSLLFAAERDEARRETVLGRGKSSAQDLEASKEEQESWLRLSMEILGSAKSGGEQGRSRALEVLSDALISPALKKAISNPAVNSATDCLSSASSKTITSEQSKKLSAIYNSIIALVKDDLSEILRIASSASASTSRHVFSEVVYADCLQTLMEQLGQEIYFVGRPEIFHTNYMLSQCFLEVLADLAPDADEKAACLGHPVLKNFQARWQFSVYFQMRLRQVVGELESDLADGEDVVIDERDKKEGETALMRGTQGVIAAFARLWGPDVHLNNLLQREWRLALQICSRYKSWLDAVLPDLPPAPQDISGPPAAVDEAKSDDILKRSLIITADLILLERQLLSCYDTKVEPHLKAVFSDDEEVSQISSEMRLSLQHTLSFTNSLVPTLIRSVKQVLCAKCAEPLRMVRQLSTQYRSGSNSGSRHARSSSGQVGASVFVPQLFKSLRAVFSPGDATDSTDPLALAAQRLDVETKHGIIEHVVGETVDKYAAVLFNMNQTHESLRRLKRSNAALGFASSIFGSSSGENSTNDEEADRLKIQMQADAQAIRADVNSVAELAGISLDLDATDNWRRLISSAAGATEA